MLEGVFAAIRNFFLGLKPYVMIAPWEACLRVRLGRHVRLLGPGIHLRIPWIDTLYLQSIRLRLSPLGRQTVSTSDKVAITFNGCLGYSITDLEKLYRTLHHAEDSIGSLARAAIASIIAERKAADLQPKEIQEAAARSIDFSQWGLSFGGLYLTEFVVVKTYRLVGDYGAYMSSSSLNTESHYQPSPMPR